MKDKSACYNYSPFGLTDIVHDDDGTGAANPLRFTAREDDGTGLYYYRARYYSPQMGRFISEDPIGFAGGMNWYAYVENNPVNFTDPEGKFTGRPDKDAKQFAICAYGLVKNAMNIEKYNEECKTECGLRKSMYQCALDKAWDDFQDCLKFALPGG